MRTDKMVSVVVPNYNGKAFIEPCLRSLAADAPEAEILVVDNASADGSREQVEQRFPEVRLIALERNYGFARAVNEGIRASTRPYVILLNNDTELIEPNSIQEMLDIYGAYKENHKIRGF